MSWVEERLETCGLYGTLRERALGDKEMPGEEGEDEEEEGMTEGCVGGSGVDEEWTGEACSPGFGRRGHGHWRVNKFDVGLLDVVPTALVVRREESKWFMVYNEEDLRNERETCPDEVGAGDAESDKQSEEGCGNSQGRK